MWLNLKNIVLRKINQAQKSTYLCDSTEEQPKITYGDRNQSRVAYEKGDWLEGGTGELPGVMELFCLDWCIDTQGYVFIITHLIAH